MQKYTRAATTTTMMTTAAAAAAAAAQREREKKKNLFYSQVDESQRLSHQDGDVDNPIRQP
jgi:hypothetical protein